MNKFLAVLICLLFTILFTNVFAQKQNNNWYFGRNAGITFNTANSEPVALTDGKISTTEGTASASDKDGNLLFYTDGLKVWDRNHNPMPNGFGLHGGSSSSNSALIVPNPVNSNIFYIFTPSESEDFNMNPLDSGKGVNYSIVDMNLNNGYGDISQKNIFLFKPSCEKLAAVKNLTNNTIMVITHEWRSNAFRVFNVDGAGVNHVPIVSYTGKIHQGWPVTATGRFAVSPDGTSLAVTIPFLIEADSIKNQGDVELFNFNPNTGVVSNPRSLMVKKPTYGVAYSQDGTKFYVRIYDEILQYDLNFCTIEEIRKSKTVVASNTGEFFNAIERGPNGKIYVLYDEKNYLGVIDKPNKTGTQSNYIENAVSLVNRKGLWGLPTFMQSYFYGRFITRIPVSVCEGENLVLDGSIIANAGKYVWSGPKNYSFTGPMAPLIKVTPDMAGEYKCIAEIDDVTKDSVMYCVTVYTKPVARIEPNEVVINLCKPDSARIRALPYESKYSYLWSTGETTPEIWVKNTGGYSVVITNENGCRDTARIEVKTNNLLQVKILAPEGTLLCRRGSLPLTADKDYSSYSWSTGEKVKSIIVYNPGWYYLDVLDSNNCPGRDSIYISEIKFDLAGGIPAPEEFGITCAGSVITKRDSIINNTGFSITIDNIILQFNKEFSLEMTGTLPSVLSPGEKLFFTIKYSPLTAGEYYDTVFISITEPCVMEFKVPVHGKAKASEILLSIPDTLGNVGTRNFCIPVYGRLDCEGLELKSINLDISIEFRAKLFYITSVTKGVIKQNITEGSRRKVKISLNNVTLNSRTQILTKFCGVILLSDTNTTDLTIDNIEVTGDFTTKLLAGKLTGTGVCSPNIRNIRKLNPGSMTIFPNPITENELEILAENVEPDNYQISVYDINGQKLYSDTWMITDGETACHKINSSGFPSGLNFIIIGSASEMYKIPVVIYK